MRALSFCSYGPIKDEDTVLCPARKISELAMLEIIQCKKALFYWGYLVHDVWGKWKRSMLFNSHH